MENGLPGRGLNRILVKTDCRMINKNLLKNNFVSVLSLSRTRTTVSPPLQVPGNPMNQPLNGVAEIPQIHV